MAMTSSGQGAEYCTEEGGKARGGAGRHPLISAWLELPLYHLYCSGWLELPLYHLYCSGWNLILARQPP